MTKRQPDRDFPDDWHLLPVGDLIPHRKSVDCPCRPVRDAEEWQVVVHDAMDGRE